MTRFFVPFLLVVTLSLALGACGGGGSDDDDDDAPRSTVRQGRELNHPAGQAARSQVAMMTGGRWAQHWAALHPDHRRAVPEELYVRCRIGVNVDIQDVRVVDVFDEPVRIDGVRTDSKAVVLEMRGNLGARGQYTTQRRTTHQIQVDGQWTWIMTTEAIETFRQGRCPGATGVLP